MQGLQSVDMAPFSPYKKSADLSSRFQDNSLKAAEFQWLAFEFFAAMMIVANSIILGLEVEHAATHVPQTLQAMNCEHLAGKPHAVCA